MTKIKILVISDANDFTTDYVCVELKKRGLNYLRINRNNFNAYKINWDVNGNALTISINNKDYLIDKSLNSVYYRAPTFLRETFSQSIAPEEQIYNSQWMAFIRNLISFEDALWMNNPVSTYKAENKIYQLLLAQKIGFKIPNTLVANNNDRINNTSLYAVKSIDTAIFKFRKQEGFFYTNIISGDNIRNYDLSLAPVTIQVALEPKLDYRVTVVGNKAFPVKILKGASGVYGDWRKHKNDVKFVFSELPTCITEYCVQLVSSMNLQFGGIDLIYYHNDYYFIELNPTGEWAWLKDAADLPIDREICNILSRDK